LLAEVENTFQTSVMSETVW